MLLFCVAALTWSNSPVVQRHGAVQRVHASAARAAVLRAEVAVAGLDTEKAQVQAQPVEDAMQQQEEMGSRRCAALNRNLTKLDTTAAVLSFVDENSDAMNAVNFATALHRLAVVNKKQRAKRDQMLRDRRFESLLDGMLERSTDFTARSVSDVLWSSATLQHWPPTMLRPVLTSVAVELGKGTFEAYQLSTMVWALGRLQTKPVRLLEQMEEQAIPLLDGMNMQNFANLLWGFSALNYSPTKLLTPLSTVLLAKPQLVASAKPVEVADLALSLSKLGRPSDHSDLLLCLASRAAPDAALSSFSSRQLVVLIRAFSKLGAMEDLPEALLEAWVRAIRLAHEATPMLVDDARQLEERLAPSPNPDH